MALQSCLCHGSITHLKCRYGLATQMSVTITTSGPRIARGLVIFVGSGLITGRRWIDVASGTGKGPGNRYPSSKSEPSDALFVL